MQPPRHIQIRGPVPAAMAKRAGRYHAQLLLESTDRASLHRFLSAWLPQVQELKSARTRAMGVGCRPYRTLLSLRQRDAEKLGLPQRRLRALIGARCSQQGLLVEASWKQETCRGNTRSPFQISLRIRHPSIDPAAISRELRLEAEYSFKAGEPRESGSGIAATALHSESYWLGSLGAITSSLSGFSGTRANVARERLQAGISESLTLALDALVVGFLRTHSEFIRRIQSEEGQVMPARRALNASAQWVCAVASVQSHD